MTTTTNPYSSLRIPSTISPNKQAALAGQDSSTGKAYAQRNKKHRFITKLSVDPATSEAMVEVQYLTEFLLNGKLPTRTTIIRRALRLYTRQILQAKSAGRTQLLELERIELQKLTSNRKPVTLEEASPWQ